MKRAITIAALLLLTTSIYADKNHALRPEFESLEFLVDSCWAGQFPDGKRTDIHCYESVYEGLHLRDRHVVSGGKTLYRGETIYSWNKNQQQIMYVYWNSLGGMSTGTATPVNGTIAFPDESYTGENGESVTISSVWENVTADGYDSLSVEVYPDGERRERRVRYRKRPFAF